MIFKKNKRGDISTQQIVIIIILIASFLVLLFFLFRLNIGKQSQEQLCHNSVVMRASPLPTSAVPLECSRKYVCITKDGTCEGIENPEKIKVKSMDDIYNALAEQMADCWWMFGEGKANYMGGTELSRNYCSICSQVLFDDSLKDIKVGNKEEIKDIQQGNISKDRLYDYLAKTNYSKDKTYAQYLFKTNNMESLKDLNLSNVTALGIEEYNPQKHIGTFGTVDIGKQYFIVMGVLSRTYTGYLCVNFGGGCFALNTITGLGGMLYSAFFSPDPYEPQVEAIIIQGDKNKFMAPTIQEANSEKFSALDCVDIVTYT